MLKIKKTQNKIEIAARKKAKRFTSDFWKGLSVALACHLVFLGLFQVVSIPSEKKPFLPYTTVIADPITLSQNVNIIEHKTLPTFQVELELPPLELPDLSFNLCFQEADFSEIEKIDYQISEDEDD